MDIKIGSDGGKSCQVTITGQLSANLPKPEPVLFFRDLYGSPLSLRLDGVQHSIQEKMGFNLWWIMDGSQPMELIMPLESRGGYDLEKIQPMRSPKKAIGVALTSFKVTEKDMSFFIMLDFTR
jgi:hypothetical protein